jgi:hypothetical protein
MAVPHLAASRTGRVEGKRHGDYRDRDQIACPQDSSSAAPKACVSEHLVQNEAERCSIPRHPMLVCNQRAQVEAGNVFRLIESSIHGKDGIDSLKHGFELRRDY